MGERVHPRRRASRPWWTRAAHGARKALTGIAGGLDTSTGKCHAVIPYVGMGGGRSAGREADAVSWQGSWDDLRVHWGHHGKLL